MKTVFQVTGMMSGTSLDGVDLACCTFRQSNGRWEYSIDKAETIQYPREWKSRLSTIENGTALELAITDTEYGHFLGRKAKEFHEKHQLKPEFISSHGHTIFHQPLIGLTTQIGKGSAIAAEAQIPVICDFRSEDVALGGQGAPLVPIGDELLFGVYSYCLNLGGFGNVSLNVTGKRVAWDICPVNIVLNFLANKAGCDFDEDGRLAGQGSVNSDLLDDLNRLEYYHKTPPKSLGKEWVMSEIHPLLVNSGLSIKDQLRTIVEHIAIQVNRAIRPSADSSLFITGGGAFNNFLILRIREITGCNVIIPDSVTINFKEALIFAFLGILRYTGKVNCLKSCTGARYDNSGGAIYSFAFQG